MNSIDRLIKALEAGSYNATPSTLVQGAALQVEDLSPMMHNVCFQDSDLHLQRMLEVKSCKSTTYQFNRQLSYGQFGGSAQLEGHVGQEETSEYARIVVPMCYYSHTRRWTLVADMVATVDSTKASERSNSDGAKKIAGDVEFDVLRGKDDFSNGGVFDGNMNVVADGPSIRGLGLQVLESDNLRNAHDLMFDEYGSDESIDIQGAGTLTQTNIEDAAVRSSMNHGSADTLLVDPKVLSQYNKLTFGIQRVVLAGSPQDASGSDLRRQWTSSGNVTLKASRFLSGKTSPSQARSAGPLPPASVTAASVAVSNVTTAFVNNDTYMYFVCSVNEVGESARAALGTILTVAATGRANRLTITHPASGVVRYFNVYRSEGNPVGGTDLTKTRCRFVGKIKLRNGQTTTIFDDLGNRVPGFVTGMLVQGDTMGLRELCPYSKTNLAQVDLSTPVVSFRFLTLAVTEPRKNVRISNLRGSLN